MPQGSTCNTCRLKCSKRCSESSCGVLMSPLTLSVIVREGLSIPVGYACLDCVKNFVGKRHLVLSYRDKYDILWARSLFLNEVSSISLKITLESVRSTSDKLVCFIWVFRAWRRTFDLATSVRGVMQRHLLYLSQQQYFQLFTPVYNLSWQAPLALCPEVCDPYSRKKKLLI